MKYCLSSVNSQWLLANQTFNQTSAIQFNQIEVPEKKITHKSKKFLIPFSFQRATHLKSGSSENLQ